MNHNDLFIWSGRLDGNGLAREVLAFPFDEVSDQIITPLCALMSRYGSDKGNGWHNYTRLYHYLLERGRHSVRNVFEVGLGTNNVDVASNMGALGTPGASLRAWRDYFPNAFIQGADIDRRILFKDQRIETHYCDQASASDLAALWDVLRETQFDLIIDDGLHEIGANRTLLDNSLHMLKDSGLYVIEDVIVSDDNLRAFQDMCRALPFNSLIVKLPSKVNSVDNCLVLFRK